MAFLRSPVRESTAWRFDLYSDLNATRLDPPPPLPEASRAMARRRPSREPDIPSLCAICAVVFSGKLIRTWMSSVWIIRSVSKRLGVGGSGKTKGDLSVAFYALAGQSAQVRTFNCSLSRTEPSVKGKRTFVMRSGGFFRCHMTTSDGWPTRHQLLVPGVSQR